MALLFDNFSGNQAAPENDFPRRCVKRSRPVGGSDEFMTYHLFSSRTLPLTFAILAFFLGLAGRVSGQTNLWSARGDGFWDDPANWSLGLAPSTNQSLISIESAGSKTVTIDRFTSANYPSTMTVSNLSIKAPSGFTNTLSLDNAGTSVPLRILDTMTVTTNGAVKVVKSALSVGNFLNIDGKFSQYSGLVSVAGSLNVGVNNSFDATTVQAAYNLSGGVLSAATINMGNSGLANFTQTGGSNIVGTLNFFSRVSAAESNTYVLSGGFIIASNETITSYGPGKIIQTGGTNFVSGMLSIVGGHVTETGNYDLSGGLLSASNLDVGGQVFFSDGLIKLKQTGGDIRITGALTVGKSAGSFEHLGGSISAPVEIVGEHGTGFFNQSGGTNSIESTLYLGLLNGGIGVYNLTNGTLLVPSLVLGSNSAGTFNQYGSQVFFSSNVIVGAGTASGGTYKLINGETATPQLTIGQSGFGVYFQSGGTNAIGGNLLLGANPGSSGTYNFSSGALSAGFAVVGDAGRGTFSQSGGTNAIASLTIGRSNSSVGTYTLTAGTLTTSNTIVRQAGSGVFGQSGGVHEVINLTVSTNASAYYLTNGIVSARIIQAGNFFQYGGSVTSAATVVSRQYSQTGGSNQTLSLRMDDALEGRYLLTDAILNSGETDVGYSFRGSFTQYSGFHFATNVSIGKRAGSIGRYMLLNGSLNTASLSVGVLGTGTLSQSSGVITVSNDLNVGFDSGFGTPGGLGTYILNGGVLASKNENIGGFGFAMFDQIDGTNAVSGSFNFVSRSSGTGTNYYNLRRGFLIANDETVTFSGPGSFNQTGGTNQVMTDLFLASRGATSMAAYNVSGGRLSVSNLSVGSPSLFPLSGGELRLKQSGGIVSVQNTLSVGQSITPGSYALSGGTVSSTSSVIGDRTAGTFGQSGGTNSIETALYLGLNSGGVGTYNLTNGTLLVPALVVGSNSIGTFNQYNSQVAFNSNVIIAAGPESSGTYNLTNGITTTPQLMIGNGGFGRYIQSGGTNVVGGNLILAVNTGSTGTYTLNNGFLSADSASIGVNGRGTFNQLGGRMVVTNDFAMGLLSSFTLQNGSASVGRMEIASNAVVTLGGPGAKLDGGGIQNDGLIQGMGSVSNPIDNRGTISANSGGVLSLFGSVTSRSSNSTFATYPTSTIQLGGGLSENNGTIQLNGGTFDNGHWALVNKGLIVGNGLLRSGGLRNTSRLFLTGRTTASFIYGTVTNDANGTIVISSNSASFYGNVINNGVFLNQNGAANITGSFMENGMFFSQQAFSFFNDLNVSAAGAIVAPGFNQVYVAGNFYNVSAQAGLWDTAGVRLVFDGGSRHLLQLPGEERGTDPLAFANNFMWGSLRLGAGQSLTLQEGNAPNGSALYVGTLTLDDGTNQIASIIGNGLDIYYDANAPGNAYLNNGIFSLSGGGFIEPAVIAPKISVIPNSGPVFVLQFDFVPGKNYVIEFSNDLSTWTAIANPYLTMPVSGVYEWRDDGSRTGGVGLKRFYRIRVQ